MSAVALGILGVCVKYYRGSNTSHHFHLRQSAAHDFRALTSLLQDLDVIEDTLRQHVATSPGSVGLTESEMRVLLQKATGRKISSSEVGLVFCVFDLNRDGNLDFSEYLASRRHHYKRPLRRALRPHQEPTY